MRWISSSVLRALAPALLGCGLVSGCAGAPRVMPYKAPVVPSWGIIFTQHKAPLTTNFESTPVEAPRVGRASTDYIFVPFFFAPFDIALGNASIAEAAKNGGITKVYYADHEFLRVLGIYARYTTTVYGE